MIITLDDMNRWDFCETAFAQFNRMFGQQTELTTRTVQGWRDVFQWNSTMHVGYLIAAAASYELHPTRAEDGCVLLRAFKEHVRSASPAHETALKIYTPLAVVGLYYSPQRCVDAIEQMFAVCRSAKR